MEKKLFFSGLVLSFLIHVAGILILSLSHSKSGGFHKPFKSLEITYRDLKLQKAGEKKTSFENLKAVGGLRPHQKPKVKVLDKKSNMFSAIGGNIKDISKWGGKSGLNQKKTANITTMDMGRKISLPPLSTEKITNPKYLSYNDDMRGVISRNIKQKAYTYVHHADFEAGEVYLTFVLESSGMLQQVKIIEDKTFANDYLRRVALRSIKESNPFPPFPEGFDYPEFTFNLLISFQN